jgi:D-serine deaminase-like pyridoxal phosphate-dependent protein
MTSIVTASAARPLLQDLDTPAMLVDLTAMESNIAGLMERFRAGPVRVRPHLKTVKSPELARRLLDAGAQGVCVAKIGEAEVMAAAGIEDVLITTELAGAPKLERLAALLREHPHVKIVVDSSALADAIDASLARARLRVAVLLDIDVGQRRCGVLPGEPVLALGKHVARLPHLRIAGVQGYEGHLQGIADAAERERLCREAMDQLASSVRGLRAVGLDIGIVSTGGTGTAEFCAREPLVTEVQPGSFVFMDTSYRRVLGDAYGCALSLLSTVLSRPRAGEAVIDAGLKSLSSDSGFAEVKDQPSLQYRPAGDEHGMLSWDPATPLSHELQVGDRIELVPSHIDTTVNLHDLYYAQRGGYLEAIWPVSARGKVQ